MPHVTHANPLNFAVIPSPYVLCRGEESLGFSAMTPEIPRPPHFGLWPQRKRRTRDDMLHPQAGAWGLGREALPLAPSPEAPASGVCGVLFSLAILVLGFLLAPAAWTQATPSSWQADVRERVAARQFAAALEIVERRLGESPSDLEARGWRARLLAWTNRWPEAEAEYRRVLGAAPGDVDILLGLADVLRWQGRRGESLALLDRAATLAPQRAEVHVRRGRVLQELERTAEAQAAYREALRLEPNNAEARANLDALEPEPRHELRIETDFDHYAFADDAQSVLTRLRSRLGSRWTTDFAGNFQRRFGQDAGRFLGSVSYRPVSSATLTIGGGAARDEGVIPRGEAFFEYGHGFRTSESGAFRGVELGYRQHWLWYRDARLLVLTPSVLVYLPRDWTWSLRIAAARSAFSGTPAEWRPSGTTRLTFPLHRRLTGNLFFGVGTENFAQVDEVGRFSARTYGGGLRWQFARRHELAGYVFYQDRSQGRTQIGFGFSYGIRF